MLVGLLPDVCFPDDFDRDFDREVEVVEVPRVDLRFLDRDLDLDLSMFFLASAIRRAASCSLRSNDRAALDF